MMVREEIQKLVEKAVKDLYKKEVGVKIERPAEAAFGDYATNVAMIIKKTPQEIANVIKSDILEKVEVKNGFINFFLSKEYLQKQVEEILKQSEKFCQLKIGKNQKVNIEFISANPTGPLHIGNGRGAFFGDTLANVLEKAGYKSFREYYINDRGRQIKFLENSLVGREPSYKNEYIDELKRKGEKDVKGAIKYIVDKIKGIVKKMGIEFNKWFYESELYDKEVNEALNLLKKKDLIYEKEGATWFQSTKFGDDKDRVLIRTQEKTTYEEETYFLSDIAYLRNKFQRGFDYLIIFLGAEHHGYVNRLKAAAEALGYDKNRVNPVIMQLVKLLEKGQEVRMSKRTGVFITLDDLLNEINKDVARFFFLVRSPGSHLVFNLDLAKEQSEKNPVYYVQYAHARICSIIRKSGNFKLQNPNYKFLNHPSELALIKQLISLPEIIEDTAKDYQVQRIPQYALDLATVFHQFYRDCRVISEDKELTKARLSLVCVTKIVFKNTLGLMGISAPERM